MFWVRIASPTAKCSYGELIEFLTQNTISSSSIYYTNYGDNIFYHVLAWRCLRKTMQDFSRLQDMILLGSRIQDHRQDGFLIN